MGQISKVISKIVNFHPIELKFKDHLHISLRNSNTNYFSDKHGPKGQFGSNWAKFSKILNFHSIELKFEEHLHIRSRNSTTNYF